MVINDRIFSHHRGDMFALRLMVLAIEFTRFVSIICMLQVHRCFAQRPLSELKLTAREPCSWVVTDVVIRSHQGLPSSPD